MSTPVYMVVQITITDPEKFGPDYAAKVGPQLAEYGAEMIARAQPPHLIEGVDDRAGAAVIRFPSRAAFEDWYNSDAYAPLKAARLATTDIDTATLMLLDAVPEAGGQDAA